jgi:hypothetical protein
MLFTIDMRTLTLMVLCMLFLGAKAQQEVKFTVLSVKIPRGYVATQGSWSPSTTDIAKAEGSISQIASLKGNYASLHIDHPEQYFRQYLAIRQRGRNLLYINAFCEAPSYWRTQIVIVTDGGSCFWQALYDPATGKYSDLTINGRA